MSEEIIDANIENIPIIKKVNPHNEKPLGEVKEKNMTLVQQIIKNILPIITIYIVKILYCVKNVIKQF